MFPFPKHVLSLSKQKQKLLVQRKRKQLHAGLCENCSTTLNGHKHGVAHPFERRLSLFELSPTCASWAFHPHLNGARMINLQGIIPYDNNDMIAMFLTYVHVTYVYVFVLLYRCVRHGLWFVHLFLRSVPDMRIYYTIRQTDPQHPSCTR